MSCNEMIGRSNTSLWRRSVAVGSGIIFVAAFLITPHQKYRCAEISYLRVYVWNFASIQDFSTPCFDGQHNIIMGGSFISTGNEASVFARFHFRPHFHQHAGFRLVAPLEREEAESFVTSCTGELAFITSSVVWLVLEVLEAIEVASSSFHSTLLII